MTPDLSYSWEGALEYCEENKWDKEKKEETSTESNPRGPHLFFDLRYTLFYFAASSIRRRCSPQLSLGQAVATGVSYNDLSVVRT